MILLIKEAYILRKLGNRKQGYFLELGLGGSTGNVGGQCPVPLPLPQQHPNALHIFLN